MKIIRKCSKENDIPQKTWHLETQYIAARTACFDVSHEMAKADVDPKTVIHMLAKADIQITSVPRGKNEVKN